jgi:virginiamycin B lyase
VAVRRLASFGIVLAALFSALLPTVAGATPAGRTTLYPLPKGTAAEALAVGAGGHLWFAGVRHGSQPANVVGWISSSGKVHEFTVPNSSSALGVGDLTLGPGDEMWFTEPAANRVGHLAPNGQNGGFTVPTPESRPTGVVAAPGGGLWVSLEGAGSVALLSLTGKATELALPAGLRPGAITLGADSAAWTVDSGTGTVTRVSASPGRTISFPISEASKRFSPRTTFSDIVSGPDGKLWMSQSDGPYVDTVEAREADPHFIQYRIPAIGEGTTLVSNGPAGDIWFAGASVIGSLATHGLEIGEVACAVPSCEGPIRALAEGPEGDLWFALHGELGRFQPPALHVELSKGGRHLRGKAMPLRVECRGGAAGETCGGKVEVFLRHGPAAAVARPLGRAPFQIQVLKRHAVQVPLDAGARKSLAARGYLKIRIVVKLAGQVVANRRYLLRGGR